jgi:hypothetical protein
MSRYTASLMTDLSEAVNGNALNAAQWRAILELRYA